MILFHSRLVQPLFQRFTISDEVLMDLIGWKIKTDEEVITEMNQYFNDLDADDYKTPLLLTILVHLYV